MSDRQISQQLVDDLKVVLEQAEGLLDSTAGASGKGLEKAREKLTESVELLRSKCRDIPNRAIEAAKASRRMVQEHPYGTAGGGLVILAAVVGMIWLLQRDR